MTSFKSKFADLAVLIVDDMATQQTTLRGQLTMLNISRVDCATTAEDALRMMKSKNYGLVMCDYNLNQKSDGQQILEFLRENNSLGAQTLFFMVTAENSYASVAAASEYKPDAYLLKPVTVGDIEERLRTQIEKRNALMPAYEALSRLDHAGVVAACDKVIQAGDRFTMGALQLRGQSLLALGRNEDASALYAKVLQIRPGLIWAQLGLAKAQKAAGNLEEAKALTYDIIHSKEGEKTVEAYDVLASCLEAQGDAQAAMWTLRDSATVLPSPRRHRLVGESAYRNGDIETAKECYAKLVKGTKGSITANSQDTLMLAQAKIDSGETADAIAILDAAIPSNRHDPQFANVAMAIKAQGQVKLGDTAGAEASIARARQNMRRPKADFSTVALAKAELMAGREEEGLKLLSGAVSADHENPRVKQLIGKALRDTGREHLMQQVVDAAVSGLNSKVADARSLFRDSRIDEALQAIEAALKEYPENTGVLLQAAQMNCLALRLKKQLNTTMSERVRSYLTRLDTLMPANDRVAQMHRYYRDTMTLLKAAAPASQAA